MLELFVRQNAERDLALQAAYYTRVDSADRAKRYLTAVEITLSKLQLQPRIGHPCTYTHPKLRGLRKWRVKQPYGRMQIYYRIEADTLDVFRIVSSDRDTPKRLLDPPEAQ